MTHVCTHLALPEPVKVVRGGPTLTQAVATCGTLSDCLIERYTVCTVLLSSSFMGIVGQRRGIYSAVQTGIPLSLSKPQCYVAQFIFCSHFNPVISSLCHALSVVRTGLRLLPTLCREQRQAVSQRSCSHCDRARQGGELSQQQWRCPCSSRNSQGKGWSDQEGNVCCADALRTWPSLDVVTGVHPVAVMYKDVCDMIVRPGWKSFLLS